MTLPVGEITDEARRLLDVTRESPRARHRRVPPGAAARATCRRRSSGTWRQRASGWCGPSSGHGIGRALHEDPQVPNFGEPGRGPLLRAGMVLALEPMVTMGHWEVRVLADQWTAVDRGRDSGGAFRAHRGGHASAARTCSPRTRGGGLMARRRRGQFPEEREGKKPKDDAIEVEGKVVEPLPERHVPRRAGQRAPRADPRLGQDAHALHPDPARGPGQGRAVGVRPDARPDHVPVQVDGPGRTSGRSTR